MGSLRGLDWLVERWDVDGAHSRLLLFIFKKRPWNCC